MKTFEVEFWNSEYKGAESKLVRVEEWEYNDESFKKYYDSNNRYKYCNGTHYSFVNKVVEKDYRERFFPKHHTISNYYGTGVVD